jgi:signal transduction histidine kinase
MIKEIFNLLPFSIYWKNLSGKYVGCNDHMIKMTGLHSRKDIIGKTDHDMPWSKNAQFIRDAENRVTEYDSFCVEQEYDLFTPAADSVFLTVKTPWKDEAGTLMGVIGVLINITKQDFIQLNIKLIEQLIANYIQISLEELKHDIRSPVSSIAALSEMIKHNSQERQIKNLAEMLCNATSSLDKLIISLSNVQQEKLSSSKDTFFDVKAVIQDVLKLALPIAHTKNVILNYNFENTGPFFISSNRNLIHRILMELINNAIKYTSLGGVTLEIESIVENSSERYIMIKIIDTGLGIPADVLKRLTGMTNYSTYNCLKEGSGFGLGMINTAAKLLGIKIIADSSLNQGTMIQLIIKSNS